MRLRTDMRLGFNGCVGMMEIWKFKFAADESCVYNFIYVCILHLYLITQDTYLLRLGVWSNIDPRAVSGGASPGPRGLDV